MSVSSGLDAGTRKTAFTGIVIGGGNPAVNLAHNLNTLQFNYEVTQTSTDSKIMLPLDRVDANNVLIESTLTVAITVDVTIIG